MAADILGMRVRGGFVVALVFVVVGIGAWYSVGSWRHQQDQRHLQAARTLAHHLEAPADAAPSRECRGDGLVSCWTVPSATAEVAQAMAASLRSLHSHPTVQCDHVRVGVGSSATTADECNVFARYGSRAVAVFVNPHWQHTRAGNKIDGSLISVSAG